MVSRFSHELGYYTFFFFYYFAPPPLSPPFLYPSSPLRYTRTKRFSIFRQHVVVKNLITFPSFDDRFDDPLSCIDRRMNRDLSRTRVWDRKRDGEWELDQRPNKQRIYFVKETNAEEKKKTYPKIRSIVIYERFVLITTFNTTTLPIFDFQSANIERSSI